MLLGNYRLETISTSHEITRRHCSPVQPIFPQTHITQGPSRVFQMSSGDKSLSYNDYGGHTGFHNFKGTQMRVPHYHKTNTVPRPHQILNLQQSTPKMPRVNIRDTRSHNAPAGRPEQNLTPDNKDQSPRCPKGNSSQDASGL